MSVIIRAAVALKPGCELVYDCPVKGDSFRADGFFDKYRGKVARFVGYEEELVGPLDRLGRMPGRYINLDGIKVRFKGEKNVHSLNIHHFIVANPVGARLVDPTTTEGRVGDLPHPLLFYPDDLVRLTAKAFKRGEWRTNEPRQVGSVLLSRMFTHAGAAGYEIFETEAEYQIRVTETKRSFPPLSGCRWNVPARDLEFVERGNVWALYNRPAKLSFISDEDEAAFWARIGISHRAIGAEAEKKGMQASIMVGVLGETFASAHDVFASGKADIISLSELKRRPDDPDRYLTRKLHARFRKHQPRVRALTERLWADKLKRSAA